MSALLASAPGKLVLMGEYAVLDGASAVVAAVSARARVRLQKAEGFQLTSSLLKAPVVFSLDDSGVRWPAGMAPDLADWLSGLINAARPCGDSMTDGFAVDLDTREFFAGDDKLGLGSSSALAVAFNGALSRHWHNQGSFDAFAMHRRLQGGRGSGVDVAAAIHGGVLGFRRDTSIDSRPVIEPMTWPTDLALTPVFVGHSTSTGGAIGRYREWQRMAPGDWQSMWSRLREIAAEGERSLKSSDCACFMQAVSEYARALAELGRRAEIDIVSPAHQRVSEQVSAYGPAVYKPSGAGGGDVGVAVSKACDAEGLRAHLRAAGVTVLDLSIDDKGLEIG